MYFFFARQQWWNTLTSTKSSVYFLTSPSLQKSSKALLVIALRPGAAVPETIITSEPSAML